MGTLTKEEISEKYLLLCEQNPNISEVQLYNQFMDELYRDYGITDIENGFALIKIAKRNRNNQ